MDANEAENVVLAVLLNSRNAIFHIMDLLRPEDFSTAGRRAVYEAILKLTAQDVVPNVLTVSAELGDRYPPETIQRLSSRFTRKYEQEVVYIADVVRNAARARCAREILDLAISNVQDNPDDVYGVVSHAIGMLSTVLEAGTERASGPEQLDAMYEASIAAPMTGFPTGVSWLDRASGGILPGHIWTIAARYKARKSSIARGMILSACRAGATVDFFSLESKKLDTWAAFMAMLIAEKVPDSALSDVDILGHNVRRDVDRDAFAVARQEFKGFKINVYDATDGMTGVDRLLVQARRDMATRGLDIFFVDYLQKMRGSRDMAYFERVEGATHAIQDFAVSHGVATVILAQLNEETVKLGDTSPSPGIKGGGDAAAAADYLLTTAYNEKDTPGEVNINLKLARHARPESHYHLIHPQSGLVGGLAGGDGQVHYAEPASERTRRYGKDKERRQDPELGEE